MILETILALTISQATPNNFPAPPLINFISQPAYAGKFGSTSSSFRSSSSSFSRSSSFSSSRPPSSSFSSRPTSSFSRPSSSISAPRISSPSVSAPRISSPSISAPRISSPSIPAPSISKPSTSNNIVRINKQTETPKTSSVARPVTASPITKSSVATPVPIVGGNVKQNNTYRDRPEVVTRERYIERYNDGGIASNPWFWMYMFDQNNNSQPRQVQQAPTQVVVKDSSGESVTVPASQMIVQKDSHNPVREFFVFMLGGGIGILAWRRFAN